MHSNDKKKEAQIASDDFLLFLNFLSLSVEENPYSAWRLRSQIRGRGEMSYLFNMHAQRKNVSY
jgi:hypothetical protein